MAYGPDQVTEHADATLTDVRRVRGTAPVLWVGVDGLADTTLLEGLGEVFGLHRLALEDVINVHQRPKAENYRDRVFIVVRMAPSGQDAATNQLALFLGPDFLLTFQERPDDCLDPVRRRLREGRGIIRESKADYLAYALIDAAVDSYFPVLESYGERLEDLELAVVDSPDPELVETLHVMKRDLLAMRRAIWPHREAVNALVRDDTPLITETTRLYLRDTYDHATQLIDIVETSREIASGLVDMYISNASARLNEIMKVLTIIATVFMPIAFLASLYGMNFDTAASPWNMPELGWRYGYPVTLLIMALIVGGLLAFFWRRRWIGTGGSGDRRRRKRLRANGTEED